MKVSRETEISKWAICKMVASLLPNLNRGAWWATGHGVTKNETEQLHNNNNLGEDIVSHWGMFAPPVTQGIEIQPQAMLIKHSKETSRDDGPIQCEVKTGDSHCVGSVAPTNIKGLK